MNNSADFQSNVVLKKMDYCVLPEVLSNLKNDWPDSIHTYFFLLNFMNWTQQNWNGDFNFYCPNTTESYRSVMAVAKFKDGYTFVNYHCVDDSSCKNLLTGIMYSNILNWNELVIFEAIHDRLVPGLQEIIQAKKLKVVKNDKCYQVWLPPEKAKSIRVDLPPEQKIYYLDDNQTKLINKNWGYSGPGTEIIVRDTLAHNGGLALQLKTHDSYVGWSVEQHYGGIGMLFVHPEFRRQGFASTLVKLMARRAIDKGTIPFAIIELQNNKSKQLFEKLEFVNICLVHWIGVRK